MTRRRIWIVAAALVLAAPATALAQGSRPWTVSVDLGTEGSLAGDMLTGASGTLAGTPTTTDPRAYSDLYDRGGHWSLAVGYNLSSTGEVRFRVTGTRWTATNVAIGEVGGTPLNLRLDDYRAIGVDGGFRAYFTPWDARVRPFVGSTLGVVRVTEISGDLRAVAAGVNSAAVDFFNQTRSVTIGAEAGVQVTLGPNFAVQGGIRFRWHNDLDDEDGLAGTGLEGLNDISAQWTMPLFGGLTVRF